MSRVEIGRPSNSVTPQTPRGHHSPLTSSSDVKMRPNPILEMKTTSYSMFSKTPSVCLSICCKLIFLSKFSTLQWHLTMEQVKEKICKKSNLATLHRWNHKHKLSKKNSHCSSNVMWKVVDTSKSKTKYINKRFSLVVYVMWKVFDTRTCILCPLLQIPLLQVPEFLFRNWSAFAIWNSKSS